MKQAEAAGPRSWTWPEIAFGGGYSGYFQDPDGHLWEIAWNPQWRVREKRQQSTYLLSPGRQVRGSSPSVTIGQKFSQSITWQ